MPRNMERADTGRPDLVVTDLRVRIESQDGLVEPITGVDLTVRPGQSIGVVGESGSGKSMMCRTIMGLVPRNFIVDGSVRLGDRETVGLAPAERRSLWPGVFAMVFQDPSTALSPVKRIGEQLGYPLRFHSKISRKEARERSLELLRAVGIPDPVRRLDQYPHELSGGMRQRVVIALAIWSNPQFLFADEPTTALDVTVQAQVLDLLEAQRADGKTALVLCSHDLNVVAGRTEVVIVMYAGQIVEMAPTPDLFTSPHVPYTEALLRSVPRLDQPSHSRLQAIPGRPPRIASRSSGCRFAPRCEYATEKCTAEMPPLRRTAAGHAYRCWYPRNMAGAGMLADVGAAGQPNGVL